jgi:hypothetical protein
LHVPFRLAEAVPVTSNLSGTVTLTYLEMILSGDGGIIFHVALACEKLVAGYWTTRYSCGDSVMMFLIWVFSKRSNVGTVVLRNTGLTAILW